MPIVVISESLLRRSTAADGRILRDRVLSGFCVRLNARKRTFLVATSVKGQQYRRMLGHWPLAADERGRGTRKGAGTSAPMPQWSASIAERADTSSDHARSA